MIRVGTPTLATALLLCATQALAQLPPRKDNYLRSIDQCNRADLTTLDARINGCTLLIESRYATTTALAIAYNNRGNAYLAKGDFDHAIHDYDQSARLDRTYAKPLNNRGVAHLKKGELDLAIEAFDEAIRLDPDYGNAYVVCQPGRSLPQEGQPCPRGTGLRKRHSPQSRPAFRLAWPLLGTGHPG